MAYLESTGEHLGLTINEILNDYSITVYAGRGIHIEGHKGIIHFDGETVILKFKKQTIKIEGRELKIKELSPSDIYISGKILGVVLGDKQR